VDALAGVVTASPGHFSLSSAMGIPATYVPLPMMGHH
jgi:hypothetical protein